MSSVVIRDDDLSFWTNVDDIERLYKPLFDKKVKIIVYFERTEVENQVYLHF